MLEKMKNGWALAKQCWRVLQLDRELEDITVRLADGSYSTQTYEFPSRTDCFVCHTDTVDTVLGLRTPQLNIDFDYDGTVDNQLRSWNNINLFNQSSNAPDTYDQFSELNNGAADLTARVRAYLDINCAGCHQPGGPTQSSLDLRYQTALSATNAENTSPAFGDLGINNAAIISPGIKEQSVLWQRMNRRDTDQMPPLGTHVVDSTAVDLIGQWIDNM